MWVWVSCVYVRVRGAVETHLVSPAAARRHALPDASDVTSLTFVCSRPRANLVSQIAFWILSSQSRMRIFNFPVCLLPHVLPRKTRPSLLSSLGLLPLPDLSRC